MSAELKINIGGDSSGAQKAINDFEKSLKKVKPTTVSASSAVLDFSRIIQDSPYGFIGIANNIDAFSASLSRLKEGAKETGTTVGSVLLKSLSGGAGIGLAISAVTAAVTFATNGFGSWSKMLGGFNKTSGETSAAAQEMSKAIEEAANAVSKDVSRVTTLVSALSSTNLNLDQRKKAIEELKKINVEFFGSLKDEGGLIEGLQLAYDGYLKRIIEIGKAKAIESQLTKAFDKKLQLELSIDPKFLAATNPETQAQIGRFKKELEQLGGAVDFTKINGGEIFTNENLRKRSNLMKIIADLEQGSAFYQDATYKRTLEQIRALDFQIKGLTELQSKIQNFSVTAAAPTKPPKPDKESDFDVNTYFKKNIVDLNEALYYATEDFKKKFSASGEGSAKAFIGGFNGSFSAESLDAKRVESVTAKIQQLIALGLTVPELDVKGNKNINVGYLDVLFPPDLVEKAQVRLNAFKENLKLVQTGATQAIMDMATSFGSSIGSGGTLADALASAGEALLRILGDVLMQIGVKTVLISSAVETLNKALAKLFVPGGAQLGIAAGIGLIAVGAALKSIRLTKVPGFADGVSGFSGGLAMVGERGPELVRLPAGSDVIPNHKIGGMQSVFVTGRIRGRDIYLVNSDEKSRFDRLF